MKKKFFLSLSLYFLFVSFNLNPNMVLDFVGLSLWIQALNFQCKHEERRTFCREIQQNIFVPNKNRSCSAGVRWGFLFAIGFLLFFPIENAGICMGLLWKAWAMMLFCMMNANSYRSSKCNVIHTHTHTIFDSLLNAHSYSVKHTKHAAKWNA